MVDLSLLIVPRVRIYLGENGMHVLEFTSMGGPLLLSTVGSFSSLTLGIIVCIKLMVNKLQRQ